MIKPLLETNRVPKIFTTERIILDHPVVFLDNSAPSALISYSVGGCFDDRSLGSVTTLGGDRPGHSRGRLAVGFWGAPSRPPPGASSISFHGHGVNTGEAERAGVNG